MNCPVCDEPMELLRGEKYYWHVDKGKNWKNPKAVKCPITSMPNREKKEDGRDDTTA